jgi:hypothetical protein
LADKVDICHFSDTQVLLKSVSDNALDEHLGHGDALASDYPDCENSPRRFCLVEFYSAGLGQSTDEYYEVPVEYFPASGEVRQDPGSGSEVYSGRVSPVGYSIFRAGSYYTYTYDYPYSPRYDFVGSGMTFDDSGMFVGIWKRPDDRNDETSRWDEGEALGEYTFIPGDCSDL